MMVENRWFRITFMLPGNVCGEVKYWEGEVGKCEARPHE